MLTGLLVALTLTVPTGCVNHDKNDADDEVGQGTAEETGEETGEEPPEKVCKSSCEVCADFMKDAYACMAYDKSFDDSPDPLTTFECIVCDNDGPWSAVLTCGTHAKIQGVYYTDMEAQLVPCGDSEGTDDADEADDSDSMESAKCADWLTNRQIHPLSANEWNVERRFIDALVADPSQLIGCDTTRVKRSNGVYRVASVDSDDLLGELGLMNDDVIQSINGYALGSPFDAALAFFDLWPETRVFTVSVVRPGVGVLTFTYNLV